MKSKKIMNKSIVLATILTLTGCTKVPAGYKGVIVDLYGQNKGVSEQTVGVGRYFLGWNKELYLFPTFLQNYVWKDSESISMQTKEGMNIKSNVGITYNIEPENISKVFQKYRLGIEEITNIFLHNMVRDEMNKIASSLTIEQLYSDKKIEFMQKVNELVKIEANKDGINVDKIYLVGTFDLPDQVIASINSKIKATQDAMRVENEIQQTKAEAQKTIIEAQAKAQQVLIDAESRAKSNKLIAESISEELIKYQMIQKWNGVLPKVASSSMVPFINMDIENGK